MSAVARFSHSLDLPWTASEEQERRYRRIQRSTLLALIILAILLYWLPVPPLPVTTPPPLPAIEIVLDERPPPPALPPAPPAARQEVAVPAPATKPQPTKARPVEKPSEVTSDKSGSAPPGPTARDRARAAGINDLAAGLSDLHDDKVASKAITGAPDLTGKPNPNRTSEFAGGDDKGPGSERSLITAQAGVGSGGINTAQLSRGTGGGGLAGRGTTLVEGYGGGGNGKGPGLGRGGSGSGAGTHNGAGGGGNGTGTGSGNGTGSGSGGSRSREEIERVFEQNKGSIYAIYNRALRENPALQGKLVLKLTIQPNGVVSACEVVSSELHDAELEKKLAQRVLLFKFEARDVAPVTTTKPLEFFPT